MSGRRGLPERWQEISRSERFNGAEWLLLAVSVLALAGALMMLVRVAA